MHLQTFALSARTYLINACRSHSRSEDETTHPEACICKPTTVPYHMVKRSSAQSNRVMRLVRKYNLVQKAGGSCRICGYNKNISSLAFHHLSEKGTHLNGSHLINMSLSGAEAEVSKCVLVCHNCHNEIHNPELGLKEIGQLCKNIKKDKLNYSQAYAQFFGKNKKPKNR